MEQNLTAGGVPPMPEPDPARPYTVGTLRYSLLGVIGVSFWLILGGSCFGLLAWMMVPTVLPLSLSQFDASGATIGVITVPVNKAQEVTEQIIAGGIKALWNFTPFRIRVPEDIVVQNTSLYAHLAVMFNRLNFNEIR